MRSLAPVLLVLAGCTATPTSWVRGPAGGDTTVLDRSSSAFENPAPNLSAAELERHFEGDVAFESTFVSAPSVVNPGLGPLFVNTSCKACHPRNGRGLPVTGNGPRGSHLFVRVSSDADGPAGLQGTPTRDKVGGPLRDHAISGSAPEARIEMRWTEVDGEYADGQPFELRAPDPIITLASGEPLPQDVLTSLRIPRPIFGLGLLEAVPDEALVEMSDPWDLDDDGISGRPNIIWDAQLEDQVFGRFGWKSNQPNVLQNTAGGFASVMGVSNPLSVGPDETPDIDDETLRVTAFYMQTLAVPARADVDDPLVQHGEALFDEIGCASCHRPDLQTGTHEISALSNQSIHPYTDLLIHDMGPGLADRGGHFDATGAEWRTPPLWGIGLTETTLGDAVYLHDGRARSLEEAIMWHGGEAAGRRDAFQRLPAADRAALVRFLLSL